MKLGVSLTRLSKGPSFLLLNIIEKRVDQHLESSVGTREGGGSIGGRAVWGGGGGVGWSVS